jgi:hypothetical protein
VHSSPQLRLDFLQLGPHAVAPGLPLKLEGSPSRFAADEHEAQKREGLRLAEPALLAVLRTLERSLSASKAQPRPTSASSFDASSARQTRRSATRLFKGNRASARQQSGRLGRAQQSRRHRDLASVSCVGRPRRGNMVVLYTQGSKRFVQKAPARCRIRTDATASVVIGWSGVYLKAFVFKS